MWCYQKPGFEALLLAELQRQQQCNQFCDTLLKAEGVSVPAHSCILSAISPHFLSSLSSTLAPAAGQSRLLEFQALGACTLLHMVRLLYSGKMVGEGEKEKQDAISAAAKLGIDGLVEVTHKESCHRNATEGSLYTEVGVQTESEVFEDNQVRLGGWRREVRDGSTLLWREMLPTDGIETWTQTENLQMSSSSTSDAAVSFTTIDMDALQSLGQTDSFQIPYVPVSVVYPPEDNQGSAQSRSSVSAASQSSAVHYPSVQPNVLSFSSQAAPCAADTQSWGGCREIGRAAVMEEWAEEGFEEFEGNIPGFINYFLNPEKNACSNRRRGRRRQRAGVGASRRAGTSETRARRARGGTPGRRRNGLLQTVDVQEVGVSKVAKMFLQRWGMHASRTGQGGGAVGKRLYLKTREFLRSGRSNQRRRSRGIEWDINQCANILLKTEGATNVQRGRKKTPQHQRVSRGATHPPPPTRIPEEQPEQIDRLLEEVMIGLHILPNNNKKSLVAPSSSCTVTSNNSRVQSKHLRPTAAPQCHGPTQVVTVSTGGRDASNSDVPVLQLQHEGELPDMLDQFFQSFERLESAAVQSSTESNQPHTIVNQYRKSNTQVTLHTPRQQDTACPHVTPSRRGRRPRPATHSETSESESPKRRSKASTQPEPGKSTDSSEKNSSPAARRICKRRKVQYLFSLEKPRVKVKKAAMKKDEVEQRVNKQLQQIPVVKLERRGMLPENIRLQELSQSSLQTSCRSPSVKLCSSTPERTPSWATKIYPIRSRFREAQIMNSIPFLEEPLPNKLPPTRDFLGHRGRRRKNGLLPSLSAQGISRETMLCSLSNVEERIENNNGEEGSTVQPLERNTETESRGKKRSLDSGEEANSEVIEVKRIRLDSELVPAQSTSESTEAEEVIDVDTVSLNSTGSTILINNSEFRDRRVDLTVEESSRAADSDRDEIIDVDGDCFESSGLRKEGGCTAQAEVMCTITTENQMEDIDDDIDVIGGSSPAPSPVFIHWTDSSEGEQDDNDVEVHEEQTAYMSVVLSKGELVRC